MEDKDLEEAAWKKYPDVLAIENMQSEDVFTTNHIRLLERLAFKAGYKVREQDLQGKITELERKVKAFENYYSTKV